MRYSVDLRKRVLVYVEAGGSKAEAARRFAVTTRTIYNWLEADDPLTHAKPGPRGPRKLDWETLRRYVVAHDDALLSEIAAHFQVSINAVWYACERMKLPRKKNLPVFSGNISKRA
jgi:transposase